MSLLPSVGDRAVLPFYLSAQRKVPTFCNSKIFKCALRMCTLNFDYLTSCHFLCRVVLKHKLTLSAAQSNKGLAKQLPTLERGFFRRYREYNFKSFFSRGKPRLSGTL